MLDQPLGVKDKGLQEKQGITYAYIHFELYSKYQNKTKASLVVHMLSTICLLG